MTLISKWINKNLSSLPILSLLLLFSGVLALGFTYIFVPTLVPGYGGGEPFQLDTSNNYTVQFPWYSKTRISLTIKANNSVNVFIDGNSVYNGSLYSLSIAPKSSTLITLKSVSATSGRFIASQEPSIILQFCTWGYFLFSLVITSFLILKLRKQR